MNYFLEYSLLASIVSSATQNSWLDDGPQIHHPPPSASSFLYAFNSAVRDVPPAVPRTRVTNRCAVLWPWTCRASHGDWLGSRRVVVTERRRHQVLGAGHGSKLAGRDGAENNVVESATSATETEPAPSVRAGRAGRVTCYVRNCHSPSGSRLAPGVLAATVCGLEDWTAWPSED